MRSRVSIMTGVALLLGAGSANATVSVAIDLTHQQMHVVSAKGTFDWPISSARSGFTTPDGSFAPTHLERMHYSKKYHMSPMPYSIFFRGGFAIHGTYAVGELGRPASHGCVRLSPGHAAALYGMVQAEGARISISGTPPASRPFRRDHEARRAASPGRSSRRPSEGAGPRGFDYSYPDGYQAYSYPYGARPAYRYGPASVDTPQSPQEPYDGQ